MMPVGNAGGWGAAGRTPHATADACRLGQCVAAWLVVCRHWCSRRCCCRFGARRLTVTCGCRRCRCPSPPLLPLLLVHTLDSSPRPSCLPRRLPQHCARGPADPDWTLPGDRRRGGLPLPQGQPRRGWGPGLLLCLPSRRQARRCRLGNAWARSPARPPPVAHPIQYSWGPALTPLSLAASSCGPTNQPTHLCPLPLTASSCGPTNPPAHLCPPSLPRASSGVGDQPHDRHLPGRQLGHPGRPADGDDLPRGGRGKQAPSLPLLPFPFCGDGGVCCLPVQCSVSGSEHTPRAPSLRLFSCRVAARGTAAGASPAACMLRLGFNREQEVLTATKRHPPACRTSVAILSCHCSLRRTQRTSNSWGESLGGSSFFSFWARGTHLPLPHPQVSMGLSL